MKIDLTIRWAESHGGASIGGFCIPKIVVANYEPDAVLAIPILLPRRSVVVVDKIRQRRPRGIKEAVLGTWYCVRVDRVTNESVMERNRPIDDSDLKFETLDWLR